MQKSRKKIGIAFGSGGVRGLAHIGALRCLLDNNIPIDYLAGTSVGAWVASLYGLHQDFAQVEMATVGYQKEKMRAMIEPTVKGGLIKGKKIEAFLQQWFGNTIFENTKIPTTVVAADLVSGKEVLFATGPITTAVRASMAIPFIFAPVHYQNMILVDGGIVNPVPDDVVRKMGADVVIAINLDRFTDAEDFSTKKLSLRNVAGRSYFIARHTLAAQSQITADVIIEPHMTSLGFKVWKEYFGKKKLYPLVTAGYKAMNEKIDIIKNLI
ncbi:MAG: hypothetical protein A2233_04595 [Candidatus Kerfeldbacteria bacterium RIFOXYA2_FULL_38_24]|uniref:PNPLA domain-containing protein n=1 Tax=Candidatus Kerfeldbacteria bacterium RIFOXYB2_FULL_38_14 TaxID=1798547 RepID=A0A1G2BFR9_9BACT|nr:MAG: hypothetical protein A2319_02485 [Candidatus Kerfeldbacteria bacterium RIFOXYB2_FULL_38_14]OGY88153.1 MAG: hypothetical protein A2233_04595 [Candidatus Kerfeldbacteria bacterium RIFOXYA2_FULL_38_24]OGY89175.1 MAG: hypothetical protein A2458_01070 [Candidatus Kerfeldbacteria bacterium RIFOXYC2_FULL_38_9]